MFLAILQIMMEAFYSIMTKHYSVSFLPTSQLLLRKLAIVQSVMILPISWRILCYAEVAANAWKSMNA